MKCVSRSDWKGTFPTVKLELTESMQKEMTGIKQYEKIVIDGEVMPTLGSTATSHKLSDMVGLSYDDPKWEELCNLIGVGYHGTIHLDSVSKPETHDENGPQGFSANLTDLTGNAVTLCAYTDENIMAATLIAMRGYELDGEKVKIVQKVNAARKAAIAGGMSMEETMKTITDETV